MRQLPIVAAIAVVVGSGFVHGVWTDRWKAPAEVGDVAARLDRVPMTIGDWAGRAMELDQRSLEIAGVAGYFYRRYENQRTGAVATVLIVYGRPGPISVHTPDVCYAGIGYDVVGQVRHLDRPTPPAQPAAFWRLDLRREQSVIPEHLRIFYAWNAARSWEAPENPRLAFARAPVLYKLYVICGTKAPDEPLEGDPALELARQLLPQLDRALFSGSDPVVERHPRG